MALLLKNNGIDTPEEFLAAKPSLLGEIFQKHSSEQILNIYKMVSLYVDRKFIIKEGFSLLDPKDVIFFDLESDPYNLKKIFLVSFADDKGEPEVFFKDFTNDFYRDIKDYLTKQDRHVLISSSGNNWDFLQLQTNLSKIYPTTNPLHEFQGIDLNSVMAKSIISPVGTSVKKLSRYLNFQPDKDIMKDKRVKSYVKRYNLQGQTSKQGYVMSVIYKKKKFKPDFVTALIEYNKLDVKRLRHIYCQLYEIITD